MINLEEEWRLDHYLHSTDLTHVGGVAFLVDEIVKLHRTLTEKAIVCAYMWVLHDHQSVLETDGALAGGRSYFDVASFYAQELQTMLNIWPV